jgi:DNA-binding IclR family transcriptional regulator
LPESRVDDIVSEVGLPQVTSNTITDPDTLFAELETVRERGYSFADEEQMTNIRAVAAPITLEDGTVAGALAISGPTSRLQGEQFREELPQKVVDTANVCEVNLQTESLRSDRI